MTYKQDFKIYALHVLFSNPNPDGNPIEWTPVTPGEIRYLNITANMAMVEGYETERMKLFDDILFS